MLLNLAEVLTPRTIDLIKDLHEQNLTEAERLIQVADHSDDIAINQVIRSQALLQQQNAEELERFCTMHGIVLSKKCSWFSRTRLFFWRIVTSIVPNDARHAINSAKITEASLRDSYVRSMRILRKSPHIPMLTRQLKKITHGIKKLKQLEQNMGFPGGALRA